MRKLFQACLVILLLIGARGSGIMIVAGRPAAVSCSLPDSFTTDPFASCWTRDYDTSFWSWGGSNVLWTADNSLNTYYARYNTATSTVTQWAKVKIDQVSPSTGVGAGIILRATSTAAQAKYIVYWKPTSDYRMVWAQTSGSAASQTLTGGSSCTSFGPITYPLTVGVLISGTGATSVLKAWSNPSGDCADSTCSNWGAATCSYSIDCTTAGPASSNICADTGKYFGIAIDQNSYGNGSNATFDDFTGGSF